VNNWGVGASLFGNVSNQLETGLYFTPKNRSAYDPKQTFVLTLQVSQLY